MAYQTCPKCGSLRLVIDFNTDHESLEPCDYCGDARRALEGGK
jgi:hypothetical protein